MTYKELTKFLRDVRKKQQLKMTNLAASIGVSDQSVGNWEWAGRTPTLFNLQAWANALGYDLEFTLTPRPPCNPPTNSSTSSNKLLKPTLT